MPYLGGIDPKAILRILATGERADGTPAPQTPEQIEESNKYGYGLMNNMQLQGNAQYGPMNAVADSLRGYIGGRRVDQGYRDTQAGLQRGAERTAAGIFPGGDGSQPAGGQVSSGGNTPVDTTAGNSPLEAPAQLGAYTGSIPDLVKSEAAKEGVAPALALSVVKRESDFNPNAKPRGVANSKYSGLMQLSPEEFYKYGGKGDITNPVQNVRAGLRKLKAEAAQYEQMTGKPATPDTIYLIHNQGLGGAIAHENNPDGLAWTNMYKTAEGQKLGQKWAKMAIWNNLSDKEKAKFGSVDNVRSKDFTTVWGAKILGDMNKFDTSGQKAQYGINPGEDMGKTGLATSGGPESMQYDPRKSISQGFYSSMNPNSEPGRAQLAFNQDRTMNPGAAFPPEAAGRGSILDQTAPQIGQQVAQAGIRGQGSVQAAPDRNVGEITNTTVPERSQGNTANSINPGVSVVPKGSNIPTVGQDPLIKANMPQQDAGAAPDLSGRMGLGMPGGTPSAPEGEQPQLAQATGDQTAQPKAPNSGQLMNIPSNPLGSISKKQLQDIIADPFISPELKKFMVEKATNEGAMQSIDVPGGHILFNNRTKEQTYVPVPKYDHIQVRGIQVPVMIIQRTMGGKPETLMLDGTPVNADNATGGNKLGGPGGQGQGGIEGLADRAREIERKDKLVGHQADAQSAERKTYIDEGRAADHAKIGLQKMRELENAPEMANITTGSWAPAWNEFKQNMKAWAPELVGSKLFKEGPITISDVYQGMATVVGAQLARSTDPNPSVRQFEALIRTNPSIAQVPAARKALLSSLIFDTEMRSKMGQVARSDKSQEQYDQEIQKIREEAAKKQVIPPQLLQTLKGADKNKIATAKWLQTPEEYKDVKPNSWFFTPEGELRYRNK